MTEGIPESVYMRFAVIPTNGRACLDECVEAVAPQVDRIILINTTGEQLNRFPIRGLKVDQFYAETEEPNISAWWNMGLFIAESQAKQGVLRPTQKSRIPVNNWWVAVLNDDAIVPRNWFEDVRQAMIRNPEGESTAGCSGSHDVVLRVPEAVPLDYRMQGYAFMLAGHHGLRANEDFRWYYSDDYIDWESRKRGGMTMVHTDQQVRHLYPNQQVTGQLQEFIAKDAGRFMTHYGKMPW